MYASAQRPLGPSTAPSWAPPRPVNIASPVNRCKCNGAVELLQADCCCCWAWHDAPLRVQWHPDRLHAHQHVHVVALHFEDHMQGIEPVYRSGFIATYTKSQSLSSPPIPSLRFSPQPACCYPSSSALWFLFIPQIFIHCRFRLLPWSSFRDFKQDFEYVRRPWGGSCGNM